LDGGPIDRVISRYGGGCRCTCLFHAKRSLGRWGEQHTEFDDIEERLGLSRTIRIELAEAEHTEATVAELRGLSTVESVAVEGFAYTFAAVTEMEAASRIDVWEPHEQIHAVEAHRLEPGDERVRSCVADTGVVVGHPEFQRRCLAGYDTVDLGMGRLSDDVRLVGDSRGTDYNPNDEVGHGSGVAGIMGAQGWRVPPGVGGHSLLLPLRLLAAARTKGGRKRTGVGAQGDIDSGLKVGADLGADLFNLSFGTPAIQADPNAPPPHSRPVAYALAHGCTLVAAAGNSGRREAYYPAALEGVIAVGSVSREGERSKFSTYGPHLDLCAPGEGIFTAGRRGYQFSTGTSFAAPFVSGVAALLIARAKRLGQRITPDRVRTLLIESASPLGRGFNEETGHGLLNAVEAIRRLDAEFSAASLGRTA
jgi:subtilisin family serine protease